MIVSHDPQHWNFSDNTDLSEVLIIAKKLQNGTSSASNAEPVLCINLWRHPSDSWEALSLARSIREHEPPLLDANTEPSRIRIGETQVGEAITMQWNELKNGTWLLPCAFAQIALTKVAYNLVGGQVRLPGSASTTPVPITKLESLAKLGPDRRDVYDGFELTSAVTLFPAFWGHDAPNVGTLAQSPNRFLTPLSRARVEQTMTRHLRRAEDLWPKAGRVLLAERLWLNSQRLVAVRLPERVLSNVWWPTQLIVDNESQEKALVLWLNSSLGLTLLLANREETRGAWVDFKKPTLAATPVLNVSSLSVVQLRALAAAYDQVATQDLQPLKFADVDPIRAEIDRLVASALGLPDLGPVRDLLSHEPIFSLRSLVQET
jgi:hypothetical protein